MKVSNMVNFMDQQVDCVLGCALIFLPMCMKQEMTLLKAQAGEKNWSEE
jgi:hypothetical protein